MFIRSDTGVPAPTRLVLERLTGELGERVLHAAWCQALTESGDTGHRGSDPDRLDVQTRIFRRGQVTVVAIRVLAAAGPGAAQPTLDANLEIEPSGQQTRLVLTGVVRPGPQPDRAASGAGREQDLLPALAASFLTGVAALLTPAGAKEALPG